MAVRSIPLTLGACLVLAALIAGCGSNDHPTSPAGTTTTGFTQGAITAFGTIHLGSGANERVFHTDHAVLKRVDDGVTHDRMADDNSMFRLGMKVQVFLDADTSEAREVRFMNDLEGPITALPSAHAGATFDVLGVPVLVDAQTHFDDSFGGSGLTLSGLAAGNVIELSGDLDANGVLHATFIEGKHASAAGRTFEIKGAISGLSGSAPNQTFTVNGAPFTTNASSQLHDLTILADGASVEVKTQSTAAPFVVTRIEGLSGDFEAPENEVRGADKASVEGFVTNLTGSSPNFSFMLGRTRVTTSAATSAGLSLVVLNAHVEAEGPVGTTGEIQAIRITARP